MRRRLGAVLASMLLLSPVSAGWAADAPSPPGTWVTRKSADLVLLDKTRAQATPITVAAGQSTTFGSLTITVRSCAARPPDLPQNSAAFVDITDSHPGAEAPFHGWILSNTPAVSQYEHPVYDVRLMECH